MEDNFCLEHVDVNSIRNMQRQQNIKEYFHFLYVYNFILKLCLLVKRG